MVAKQNTGNRQDNRCIVLKNPDKSTSANAHVQTPVICMLDICSLKVHFANKNKEDTINESLDHG